MLLAGESHAGNLNKQDEVIGDKVRRIKRWTLAKYQEVCW